MEGADQQLCNENLNNPRTEVRSNQLNLEDSCSEEDPLNDSFNPLELAQTLESVEDLSQLMPKFPKLPKAPVVGVTFRPEGAPQCPCFARTQAPTVGDSTSAMGTQDHDQQDDIDLKRNVLPTIMTLLYLAHKMLSMLDDLCKTLSYARNVKVKGKNNQHVRRAAGKTVSVTSANDQDQPDRLQSRQRRSKRVHEFGHGVKRLKTRSDSGTVVKKDITVAAPQQNLVNCSNYGRLQESIYSTQQSNGSKSI